MGAGRSTVDDLALAAGAPPVQLAAFDAAIQRLHTSIQLATRGGTSPADGGSVQSAARAGIAQGGGKLPHADAIQTAFGSHDVSGIQAHVGGAAKDASESIGAEAYATGRHVAFRRSPDLHTAAHEAAHVVQQRAGVQLAGGVGRVGDPYERQADAVADAVVQGKSAEHLLGAQGAKASGASDAEVTQRAASTGQGAAAARAAVAAIVGRVKADMTKYKALMQFVLDRVQASLTALLVQQHPDDVQLRNEVSRFVTEMLGRPRVASEGNRGRYPALADALGQVSQEFAMQAGKTCALEVVASLHKKTQPAALVAAMTRELGNVHPSKYGNIQDAAMAKIIGVPLATIEKQGLSPGQITQALRVGKIPNEHKDYGLRQQAVGLSGLLPMIKAHVASGGIVLLFVVKGKWDMAPAHEVMALHHRGAAKLYNPTTAGLDDLSALDALAKEYPAVQSYQKVSWQHNPFKGMGQPGASMSSR